MRFSCEKCWDNPCTCGHEQREGDRLRAEFARDNPPPPSAAGASTKALEAELAELGTTNHVVNQLLKMRHLADATYWSLFGIVALAKALDAQVKANVELASNKPIVVTLPAAETVRLGHLMKVPGAVEPLVALGPFRAAPGEDVGTFSRRLIQKAEAANDLVSGTHNSFTLCAWPGATVSQMLASWNERQKASYFGGGR